MTPCVHRPAAGAGARGAGSGLTPPAHRSLDAGTAAVQTSAWARHEMKTPALGGRASWGERWCPFQPAPDGLASEVRWSPCCRQPDYNATLDALCTAFQLICQRPLHTPVDQRGPEPGGRDEFLRPAIASYCSMLRSSQRARSPWLADRGRCRGSRCTGGRWRCAASSRAAGSSRRRARARACRCRRRRCTDRSATRAARAAKRSSFAWSANVSNSAGSSASARRGSPRSARGPAARLRECADQHRPELAGDPSRASGVPGSSIRSAIDAEFRYTDACIAQSVRPCEIGAAARPRPPPRRARRRDRAAARGSRACRATRRLTAMPTSSQMPLP
jgi:hypothetical protein